MRSSANEDSDSKKLNVAADQLVVSERDGLRILALIENPARPNAKMAAAAAALPPPER